MVWTREDWRAVSAALPSPLTLRYVMRRGTTAYHVHAQSPFEEEIGEFLQAR